MLKRLQQFLLFGTILIIVSTFVLLHISKVTRETCYDCYVLKFQNFLNYYEKNFVRSLLSSSELFYVFSSNSTALIYFPFEETSCEKNLMIFPFLLAIDKNDVCRVSRTFVKFPVFTNFSLVLFDENSSIIYIYGNESYYVDLSNFLEINYFNLYIDTNISFSESRCYYIDYFPVCFSENSMLLVFFDDVGLCFYGNGGTLEVSFSKNISKVEENVVKVENMNYYLYVFADDFKVNSTERKVYIYSKEFCLEFSSKLVAYNVSLFKAMDHSERIKITNEILVSVVNNRSYPLSVETCSICNFSKLVSFVARKFEMYLVFFENYTELNTNASCFLFSSTLLERFNDSIKASPGLYYLVCSDTASVTSSGNSFYISNELCILSERNCLKFFKQDLPFPYGLLDVEGNTIHFTSNYREENEHFYYVCNCSEIYCDCLILPKYYVSNINSTCIELTENHINKVVKMVLPKETIWILDSLLFSKNYVKFYKVCYGETSPGSYFLACR